MLKYVYAAGFAMVVLAGAAFAQQGQGSTPHPKNMFLKNESVSGVPGKTTTMVSIEWPPGASTGRHYHDGDEYGLVTEGTIEVKVDGKPAKTYKQGEAYHNVAGVVHETRNVSTTATAYTIAVFVLTKGKPLSEPAK